MAGWGERTKLGSRIEEVLLRQLADQDDFGGMA